MTNLVVAYSNAVLAVLMPRVGEFAGKLDLPEQRCSVAEVRKFSLLSDNKSEGVFVFKNGNIYRFAFGFVQSFVSGHSYYEMQPSSRLDAFYGPLNMTKEEAVALARKTIRDLGYSEEMLYADLAPEVRPLPSFGTNIIPHYHIEWPTPNYEAASARFEVNGSTKRIESAWFLNRSLFRDPPEIPGFPTQKDSGLTELPVEQSWPLTTNALPKIASLIKALKLPTVMEPQTNTIKSFKFRKDGDWCAGTIRFHDGYAFGIEGNKVVHFSAPDTFFGPEATVRAKDFFGNWKIPESEAVSIARATLKKLAIPDLAFAGEPSIDRPLGGARELIPRYNLRWYPEDGALPFTQVEIDGEYGTVKSLTILNH